jgi:hypothetical protein
MAFKAGVGVVTLRAALAAMPLGGAYHAGMRAAYKQARASGTPGGINRRLSQ